MLQSQVNYWTLQENVRSHLAQEAIARAQTNESIRHNLAVEQFNTDSLLETARHNKQGEALDWQKTLISRDTLSETHRANYRKENQNLRSIKETIRHNKATEALQQSQIGASYANIQLGYSELSERTRSNRANEQISSYNSITSRATQEESKRHNIQSENQQRFSNTISYAGSLPSQSQADTRKQELETNKQQFSEMAPYNKAEKATSSFSNITEGVRDLSQARKNKMDAFKSFTGAFQNLVSLGGKLNG